MPTKYTRENFKKDLDKLSKILNKKSEKVGGKAKTTKKVVRKVAKKSNSEKRYFKVVEVNGRKHEMGRYSGNMPQNAAKKAVTRICAAKKMSKDNCSLTFSIQETTQGSEKKIYGPGHSKTSVLPGASRDQTAMMMAS